MHAFPAERVLMQLSMDPSYVSLVLLALSLLSLARRLVCLVLVANTWIYCQRRHASNAQVGQCLLSVPLSVLQLNHVLVDSGVATATHLVSAAMRERLALILQVVHLASLAQPGASHNHLAQSCVSNAKMVSMRQQVASSVLIAPLMKYQPKREMDAKHVMGLSMAVGAMQLNHVLADSGAVPAMHLV